MRIADLSDLANVRQKLPFDSFQQGVLNLKQQISHQIRTPADGLFVPPWSRSDQAVTIRLH